MTDDANTDSLDGSEERPPLIPPGIHSGFLSGLFEYRTLVWDLAKRDFRARYVGSVAGMLWAIVHPAAMVIIFFVVFAGLMGDTLMGGYGAGDGSRVYLLYLTAGLLPYRAFEETLGNATVVYETFGSAVGKQSFPLQILPASVWLSGTFTLLIHLLVLLGLGVWLGEVTGQTVIYFALAIFLQKLLESGIALGAATLHVFSKDVRHVVGIGLFILFWATPIVYSASIIESPVVRKLMEINPMTTIIDLYRVGLGVPNVTAPSALNMIFVAWTGVGLLVISAIIFRRLSVTIPERV